MEMRFSGRGAGLRGVGVMVRLHHVKGLFHPERCSGSGSGVLGLDAGWSSPGHSSGASVPLGAFQFSFIFLRVPMNGTRAGVSGSRQSWEYVWFIQASPTDPKVFSKTMSRLINLLGLPTITNGFGF